MTLAPSDDAALADLAEENRKLRKINTALMNRIERSGDLGADSYSLFQTAVALQGEVQARTNDLNTALDDLRAANLDLSQARDEAETTRRRLTDAIDSMREGFALFDANDRLVICNAMFCGLFPSTAAQVKTGIRFRDYARLISQASELRLDIGQDRESWLAMRLDLHGRRHASFIQQLADDRWVQVSERRAPGGAAAIIQTDITDMVRWERRERARRVDEEADRLRAALDHMKQGVCVFDSDMRLTAWNDRFRVMLGLPFSLASAGCGFDGIAAFFESTPAIRSVEIARRIAAWARGTHPRPPFEAEIVRANGLILDASCGGMPDGGFVITFTDVTARRKASEELTRAKQTLEQRVEARTADLAVRTSDLILLNAALTEAKEAAERADLSKTRFLAAASHDLLQPLNAARLFISSFDPGAGPLAQERLIHKIDSAFESVETLLSALLDISKLDAGVAVAAPQPVAVVAILDPILEEFRPLAARKGLRLARAGGDPVIVTDTQHMRRVLQNLISNAIKYTSGGGVVVGARPRGPRHVAIEVWDTGPGISDADRKRIFEEFQRLNNADEDGARGMGLGLAIVRRICGLLGHKVEIRSRLGHGSMFGVVAPVAREAQTIETGAAVDVAAAEETPDGMIALLIENDPEIRAGMEALLDRWGVGAVSAASGAQAVAAANELGLAPDVILADYHLDDGETGVEALGMVRAQFATDIPAVFITADRTPEVAAKIRSVGGHVMNKPVRPAALRALLHWAAQRAAPEESFR